MITHQLVPDEFYSDFWDVYGKIMSLQLTFSAKQAVVKVMSPIYIIVIQSITYPISILTLSFILKLYQPDDKFMKSLLTYLSLDMPDGNFTEIK